MHMHIPPPPHTHTHTHTHTHIGKLHLIYFCRGTSPSTAVAMVTANPVPWKGKKSRLLLKVMLAVTFQERGS